MKWSFCASRCFPPPARYGREGGSTDSRCLKTPGNNPQRCSGTKQEEQYMNIYIYESWVETNRFIFIICYMSYRVSSCTNIAMFAKMTVMQKISYLNHLYCTSQNHPSRPKRSHHPIPPPRFSASLAQGRSEATDRGTPNGSLPVDAWWAPRCKLPGNNAPTLGRLGPRFKLGHHGAPIFPSIVDITRRRLARERVGV